MTVKYHIQTPHGLRTRTTRGRSEQQYHFVVTRQYPGKAAESQDTRYCGRLDLAVAAMAEMKRSPTVESVEITPIFAADCTIT